MNFWTIVNRFNYSFCLKQILLQNQIMVSLPISSSGGVSNDLGEAHLHTKIACLLTVQKTSKGSINQWSSSVSLLTITCNIFCSACYSEDLLIISGLKAQSILTKSSFTCDSASLVMLFYFK